MFKKKKRGEEERRGRKGGKGLPRRVGGSVDECAYTYTCQKYE